MADVHKVLAILPPPELIAKQPSKVRAKAWLESLGFLSEAAIEGAVNGGWLQDEGNGELEYQAMDSDDLEELMDDDDDGMGLDENEKATFKAAVAQLLSKQPPELGCALDPWQQLQDSLDVGIEGSDALSEPEPKPETSE